MSPDSSRDLASGEHAGEAGGGALSSDGRRRRSQRSRARILEAIAEALTEADGELTPEQIAARSGYSITTIFRHFGDREGLRSAMRELVAARVGAHLAGGPFEGALPARVVELVRRLSAVFETVQPFLRTVARQRLSRTEEATGRRTLDQVVRSQISEALVPELAGRPPETVELLAAVLSPATWDHMRSTQGHSVARAAELMGEAVLRLLGEGLEAGP